MRAMTFQNSKWHFFATQWLRPPGRGALGQYGYSDSYFEVLRAAKRSPAAVFCAKKWPGGITRRIIASGGGGKFFATQWLRPPGRGALGQYGYSDSYFEVPSHWP